MTGELHAAADPTGLWAKLSAFEIGSKPPAFERRLAAEQGWSEAYACRVIAEYRRFLYLASVASFEVTPSKHVDAAWHLHLEDEAHYRDALCERLLGRYLEHRPGTPLDDERFRAQYRETLALYASAFGGAPADIWPRPADTPIEDTPENSSARRWLLAGGVAFAITIAVAFLDPSRIYLGVSLLLGIGLSYLLIRSTDRSEKRRDGACCGGSCGTFILDSSSGTDAGGDCAGCGGSCGGGGCGGGGD